MRRAIRSALAVFTLVGLIFRAIPAHSTDFTLDIQALTADPAAAGGYASTDLSAGTDPTATDRFDFRWDAESFSQPAGGAVAISAYFDHPEDLSNPVLWRDFRAPVGSLAPTEWEFRVAGTLNQDIILRWRLLSAGCESRRFVLIDQRERIEIDMSDGGAYAYLNVTNERAFTLHVTVLGLSTVPAAPFSFWSPRSIGGSVLLSWSGSGPFAIYRSLTAGSGYEKIGRVEDSFYLDSVSPGTYHYAVTAVGPDGCESPFSEDLTVQVE